MNRPLRVLAVLALALSACSLKEEGAAPPDVAAPPADAIKTPSGLASKVIRVGLGQQHPGPRSTVTVHYTGWTTDGHMFESSVLKGPPITFEVSGMIPGWVEALQLMVTGEKRRVWIPGDLAYDKMGRPDAPKGMLVFDMELISIR